MTRLMTGLFAGAVLLSFSLARADIPGALAPEKPIGLTAEQQSNDEPDVETTRTIRRALVSDDELSLFGKNVTIITVAGAVVLKGTAWSDEERARVEDHAFAIAGAGNVSSEIEVLR